MRLKNPRGRQMQAADQAGIVRIETDRTEVDLEILRFKQNVGPRNGEFADPALAKAPANHDAFGIGPGLLLEESRRHIGQFGCELLDRTMDQGGRINVLTLERLVELALGHLLGGFLAERVLTVLFERLAQIVEDFAEGALGCAVAEEAVLVLQFDIEAIHVHGRQTGRPVPPNSGTRQNVLGHLTPAKCMNDGTTLGKGDSFRTRQVANRQLRAVNGPYSLFATPCRPFLTANSAI